MPLLKALFRLFGYEWVLDTRPQAPAEEDPIADEGYDHITNTPRYRLRKIQSERKS